MIANCLSDQPRHGENDPIYVGKRRVRRPALLGSGCWILHLNACLEIAFWQAGTPALLNSDLYLILSSSVYHRVEAEDADY